MQRSYLSTRSNTWGVSTPTPRRVTQIASSIVIAISGCVLISWQLKPPSIGSLFPGAATMKANTAVCLIWAGISLLLQTRKRQDDRAGKLASFFAIGVNVTAFLTLCQYIFGWNLGIDELLFVDPGAPATLASGRMGINTAVNFCLLGTALWLMNRSRRDRQVSASTKVDKITIAQGLTIGTIAIAIQAIVGYAYNVRPLYQLTGLTTSMALLTAICFALLGGGILVLTGDRGLMQVVTSNLIGSKVARRLMPTAIGLPLVLGWLILLGLGANWYDPNFALSLMAMAMAGIWLGLIRQNAGKLNRLDDERLHSVDRIRSSEERLRLALLGAKQGIWEFDVQTQTLTWDDRCKEMFGLMPDALVTYTGHLAAIHPDDRQRVAAAVQLAMRDGREFAIEYRTIYPDGTIHWVLTQGSYYGNVGAADRMLGTMMDITVRKHAELNEQFLQQLTRRLRQFTDPDEMQWETAKSLGEYLDVDRATWCKIDWSQRLATIERDWYREGLDSHAGVYALGNLLPAELQVALFAGDSVAITDVSAEPLIAPYLDTYQQLGMGAFIKVPCIFEERWVTTLNVNTQRVRVWRDDEITLMQTIVAQIWALIEQTRADRALSIAAEQTRAAGVIIAQQLGEIEAIYRSAPVGLCFVNTDLQFVRLNERLAQIDGSSISGHLGRTIRQALPELADTLEPLYRQVIASGAPILDLELSGTSPAHPEGLQHWIVSYYPQKNAEQQVVGVNVMVQEITERKRREIQLQQAEATISEQLREIEAIYRSAPVGLCFVDTDLRYVRMNEQLAQINGSSVEAHIGHSVRELLPDLADDIEPIYRQVIETGVPIIDLELSGTNPAQPGVWRCWLASYYPQIDAEDRVIGVNTVVQEITERQREAAEREQRTQALDRAAAILHDRNQELDSFVYVVSHDLKAPLRAISNLSQWIEDDLEGVLATEIQQHTVLLRSRIQRMEAIIDGLLDYARIGRSDKQIEPVSVAALLAETIDSIAPPPTFKMTIAPDLPTLQTKRLFLSQVFTNLISNAIAHHDRIDGSIEISCRDGGDLYEFGITDDGPGIAPEHHDRVFEIFKTLNPQNRTDSTGIGLAIVKKIIETEGGTIQLHSQLGQGSTFAFTWPKQSPSALRMQKLHNISFLD